MKEIQISSFWTHLVKILIVPTDLIMNYLNWIELEDNASIRD